MLWVFGVTDFLQNSSRNAKSRNAVVEDNVEIQNFSGRNCPSDTPRVLSVRVFGIYVCFLPPPTAKVMNLAACGTVKIK
jgi:hypothetical protein